jgi:NADPH-dependent 2,4-dienoyl-CoA reductase/sulfur reductase-like enzyme
VRCMAWRAGLQNGSMVSCNLHRILNKFYLETTISRIVVLGGTVMKYDVVIVGAGIAGLSCAKLLHRNKLSFIILEASNLQGGELRQRQLMVSSSIMASRFYKPVIPKPRKYSISRNSS